MEPVTLPSTKSRGVGAQLCATCTPFAAHGYDNTLCSLAAARTDRFQVPKERSQRPHARAFAHPPPIEGMQLIDKSELLDPVADDDDIEWPHNPFDIRPDCASPESPDELLAMIQFEGSPGLQEKLRGLCREFIDIFSTSVRSRPASVEPMTLDINRARLEIPANRLPPRSHSEDIQTAICSQIV